MTLRPFALILALAAAPHAAQAADFRIGGDESLNCRMTIEGEIVPGDAARFRAFLADLVSTLRDGVDPAEEDHMTRFGSVFSVRHNRICLNSPGGVMAEAIEMADTLVYGYRVAADIQGDSDIPAGEFVEKLGTAIPAGARCESACAILFMAGGWFSALSTSDNVREPDRTLHVDGRLGFHAPSLRVPGGVYTEETVSLAFDLAIDSIRLVSERMSRFRISPSLFGHMVSTPPHRMFYVDTVEQAASWAIQLAGAPRPDAPTAGNVMRICENMRAINDAALNMGDQYVNSAPADIRADSARMFWHEPMPGHAASFHWIDSERWDGFRFATRADGRLEYAAHQCSLTYDPETGEGEVAEIAPADHGLWPLPGDYGWMLFPGYLTLADLSALARRFPGGRVPPAALMPAVEDTLSGYCMDFGPDDRLVTVSSCTATYRSRQQADRRASQDEVEIQWPDGTTIGGPLPGTIPIGGQVGGWEYVGDISVDRWNFEPPSMLVLYDGGYTGQDGCFWAPDSPTIRCFAMLDVTHGTASPFRR